jgi:hypothetical protein
MLVKASTAIAGQSGAGGAIEAVGTACTAMA